ncbi:protein of unknown function [Burkholderia multivorans]
MKCHRSDAVTPSHAARFTGRFFYAPATPARHRNGSAAAAVAVPGSGAPRARLCSIMLRLLPGGVGHGSPCLAGLHRLTP